MGVALSRFVYSPSSVSGEESDSEGESGTIEGEGGAERGRRQLNSVSTARTSFPSLEKSMELELGQYQLNKKIFDAIWNESGTKSNWLQELAKKEGLGLGAQMVTSAIVTAAIYFVSTALLEKIPDMSQLLDEAEQPKWIGSKIAGLLSDPETRREFAAFLSSAGDRAAGGIINNIPIMQAITSALTRMGEPISALLKGLVLPQQGAVHEAQVKQTIFRKLSEKIEPLRARLPKCLISVFSTGATEMRAQ